MSETNPRQSAFEILYRIQRQNAYSNLVLDTYLEKEALDSRDKAYVSALVYGVTEKLKTLDYNLSLNLKQPIRKLKPDVLVILRLGAYQVLFMDRVPDSAAINESVKLSKKNRCAFASGLINAVLRNISRAGLRLPEESDENYLSIRYSCEKWIIDMWIESYGYENAVKILENSIGGAPVYLRVNTLKTNREELKKRLLEEGIDSSDVENQENSLEVFSQGNPAKTSAYKEGLFHVQDISSQICSKLLEAKPGDTVFDMCASPGGKSFTTAQHMNNEGSIISCDIYEHRLSLIDKGAERLGIEIIKTKANDASVFNDSFETADRVLCDVPCSGLGIIRRKPEIRYKLKEDIDKLHNLQYLIMCTSSKYVKSGGRLVYSTCSLNPDENNRICERFLKENQEFKAVDITGFDSYGIREKNMLSVLPDRQNTDGFFVAVFERKQIV